MSTEKTRREMLQDAAATLGLTAVTGAVLQGNVMAQSVPAVISVANCRDVVLTEPQAKTLLNRKLDDFLDDPNVRKILDEKFNVGSFKIFWAHKAADIQVHNAFEDIKKINPWDKPEDGKPPRTITWNVAVKYYQARLNRFIHEKLAPGYADAMKKYQGALPQKDKEFYDYVAKMTGYSTIEDFLGYKSDTDNWQKTPLYTRPLVNYETAIRAFNPKRSPFDLSLEDLKSVKVSNICTIALGSSSTSEWVAKAFKPDMDNQHTP